MRFANMKKYFDDPPVRLSSELLDIALSFTKDSKSLDISIRMISGLVDPDEQKMAFVAFSQLGVWAAYGFYKMVPYCHPEWLITNLKQIRALTTDDANVLVSVTRPGLWTSSDVKNVVAPYMKPVKGNNKYKIVQTIDFFTNLKLANPDIQANMFQSFIESQYNNIGAYIDKNGVFASGIKLLTLYDDWNHETWQKYLHNEKLFDLESYCYPESSFDEDDYASLLEARNNILAETRVFLDKIDSFRDKVNGGLIPSFVDSPEYDDFRIILTRLKMNRKDISDRRNVPTEYLARHYAQLAYEQSILGDDATIRLPISTKEHFDEGDHGFVEGEIDIHGKNAIDALRVYYSDSDFDFLSTVWILRFSLTKEEADKVGWSPANMHDYGMDIFQEVYDANFCRRSVYPSGWDDLSSAKIMLDLARRTILHSVVSGEMFRFDNFLVDHGLKIVEFPELRREVLTLATVWMMRAPQLKKSQPDVVQDHVNDTLRLLKRIMPDVFQASRSSEKESSMKMIDMIFSKSAKNCMTLFHLLDVNSMCIGQQMDVIAKILSDIEHPALPGGVSCVAPLDSAISFDKISDNF